MNFELLNAVASLEQPDGVIALPMGDCYVLACRVGHGEAMARLLRIKGFSQDNGQIPAEQPLSRMVTLLGWDMDALRPFAAKLPAAAEKLAVHYWPGALTLLLPQSKNPQLAHLPIGIMQPDSTLVRDLLGMQPEGALFTFEASRYNDPPARTAKAVYDALGEDVDYVLQCDSIINEKSLATVVSVDADGSVHVLRPGDIVLD